jgi:CRP/FNR family cyclic AMP-dependent transcriptional regulator
MTPLLRFAAAEPAHNLGPGELLISQGAPGGDVFVLESGKLVVERDGIRIATLEQPNALVGEMSALLGTPYSATVRAESNATVRVIKNAHERLQADPELSFLVAWLVASRLDATSALLVELKKQHVGKNEQGLLGRILSAIHIPIDDATYAAVSRPDMFEADGR